MPEAGITSIIKDRIWLISSAVGALFGVGGGLLSIGKWKASLAKKEDLQEMRTEMHEGLQEIENNIERRLYDQHGRTIFMPRKECGRFNTDFQEDLRRELAEIKENQKKMQQDYDQIAQNFFKFMGEVRAHLDIKQ